MVKTGRIAAMINVMRTALIFFSCIQAATALPRVEVVNNEIVIDADGAPLVTFIYQNQLWLGFYGRDQAAIATDMIGAQALQTAGGVGYLLPLVPDHKITFRHTITAPRPALLQLSEGLYRAGLPLMALRDDHTEFVAIAGGVTHPDAGAYGGFNQGLAGYHQPVAGSDWSEQFVAWVAPKPIKIAEKLTESALLEPVGAAPDEAFDRVYQSLAAAKAAVSVSPSARHTVRPLKRWLDVSWENLAPQVAPTQLPAASTEWQQKALAVLQLERAAAPAVDASLSVHDFLAKDGVIPYLAEDDVQQYVPFKYQLFAALSDSIHKPAQDKIRVQLAQLHLANQRPHEALMVLRRVALREDLTPADPAARLLQAIAYIARRDYSRAVPLLTDSGSAYVADVQLWQAVTAQAQGDPETALALFEQHITRAHAYPTWLLTKAYLSYANVLLAEERLGDVKDVLQTLAGLSPRGELPGEALIIMARAHMIAREDGVAENLLAQAAAHPNAEVSHRAQYEFVSLLMKRGDLGMRQAISHLENLRYLWRGDDIEEQILRTLGRLYLLRGEQRLGLERLKAHSVYYPESDDRDTITTLMTTAFQDLFLDDTVLTNHDPIQTLGIYYDFRELTPPGAAGDQLIARVSDRLKQLNLFDRAIELLDYQITYRVRDPMKRARMGAQLAELYLLQGNYQQGLVALRESGGDESLPENVAISRARLESQLLLGLKQDDDAMAVLTGQAHPALARDQATVAWQQYDYQAIMRHLAPLFETLQQQPLPHDTQMALTQLAIAYNVAGELQALEKLLRQYESTVDQDPLLADIAAFLRVDQGAALPGGSDISGDGVWPQVTRAMDHYNGFVDFYQEFKRKRAEERDDKALFNRRMRQTSAPLRM